MKSRFLKSSLTLAAAIVVGVPAMHAADWPQWQGPDRTRVSTEVGLLKQWPASGPPAVWTAAGLGAGYGSVAVVGERVFLQGLRGSQSMVIALNRAEGREVWATALGGPETQMRSDRGPGPRGTPTVDGDRLYVLTEDADLVCLKTDGTKVWQRNLQRDFGGRQLNWLFSESPLVDGPHVVVSPGGPGAGMVKLDKMTGATVWTAKELDDEAGYSSITVADVQGVRT
jgi:outer membrane protein assembly factor BamB